MSERLAHAEIERAEVQVYRGKLRRFNGGLVIRDDDAERQCLRHLRRDTPVDSFDEAGAGTRLAGAYSYAGPITAHFGHYFAEMVHRLIPSLLAHPERPMLFVTDEENKQPTGYMRQLWSLLGIADDAFTVTAKDVVVDELYVSQQGSNMHGTCHAAYLDMLDDFAPLQRERLPAPSIDGRRLYVSRSKLGVRKGGFLGERFFEQALERHGFTVFHPQDHSLADQLAIYRAAEVVMFGEGSACHGLELLGRDALRTAIFMNRRTQSPAVETQATTLRIRSEMLHECYDNMYIGSMPAHPRRGAPAKAKGCAAINMPAVFAFLARIGVVPNADFDAAKARAATADDFATYIREWSRITERGRRRSTSPDELQATFDGAMRTIYDDAPNPVAAA